MTILNIQTAPPAGQAAVTSSTISTQSTLPSLIYILTDDTYAEVTATGYLTNVKSLGNSFSNNQMALVYTTDEGAVWLKVVITYSGASILNTVVSLVQISSPGDVALPTIASNIVVSTDTVGTLANTTGTAINRGSIQAGLSGDAGTLISYPGTAANGSLIIAAANAGGAFNTTISNGTMGQSTVMTIPDAGAATGQFVVKTAAFVSGNFPQNSGTAGLVIDSGLAVSNVVSKIAANTFSGSGQIILAKASAAESANAVTASGNAGFITTSALTTAAGATYSITWTNTKITATSVIGLSIQGGTNTVQSIQFTCVAGAGSATLVIHNIGPTDALNGTIIIGYSVL
jgi:hypothetical protein